jgi:hypothetical protein
MDLKWSKLMQYPNGSKNLYHNDRTRGRVTIHLERGQTIEQYLQQHGRLPNWVPPAAPSVDPRVAAARLAAHQAKRAANMAAAPTYGNSYDIVGLRRGLNELGKPWGMSKNSFESAIRKEWDHPRKNFKNPSLTVRKKNLNSFTGKLETIGWKKIVNGPEYRQFYKQIKKGSGIEGFLLNMRGSNTNNFRGHTQVRSKIPVITM